MLDNKKISLGSWITIGHSAICELMSSFDFDWLCFDLEHSSINYSDLYNLIPIIEKNNCLPIVRVGKNDELEIKRALDAGAKGIIIPNIKNKKEAELAVKFCRYQPLGQMGVGLSRAQGYGFKFRSYQKTSTKIPILALIENKEAIKNLSEIINTKGIFGTLIGPYDLSASYGKPGQFDDNSFLNAILEYEKTCKSFKKPMGMHAVNESESQIKNKIKKGYKFIGLKLDTILLGENCEQILKKIKK